MPKRLKPAQRHRKPFLFITRYRFALVLVIFCIISLLLRLFYLQIIAHTRYATLSHQNRLEILPITPHRGWIYDRNGQVLAKNVPTFSLSITPNQTQDLHHLLKTLKKIGLISQHDIKNFIRRLKKSPPSHPTLIKQRLNEKQMALFYTNRYQLSGANIQTKLLRTYPLGKVTSNIIGYVGSLKTQERENNNPNTHHAIDIMGKRGIEKYYDAALHGSAGTKEIEVNANGDMVRDIKQRLPTPGDNLYLTIDSTLQNAAEQILGRNEGAVVVLQPRTGQILALVSQPSFDPQIFLNGASPRHYQQLRHALSHPLFNRATQGQYAPGSTIKPFIAIGGLEKGTITTQSKIYDLGWFRLPNTSHIYHDWKPGGHGWVTLTQALIVSCDTFFYQLATEMGIEKISQTLAQWGFGEKTQIDLPEEAAGLLPTPTWKWHKRGEHWYIGDTILTAIGQGFLLTTPIQLAEATAILAEHGQRIQPHLLLKIQQPDGQVETVPTLKKRPLTLKKPQYWNTIINAMQKVINSPQGTAIGFGRQAHYSAAGKTGTAQVYRKPYTEGQTKMHIPKKLRNNHLFISFAPIKDPQIVVVVVIEHAAHADRIARHIMDFYFTHRTQSTKSTDDE